VKLYHFTSPLHVESCKKNGLTRGVIPLLVNGKIAILPGYQWLTANPDFNQSWANTEYTTLPYDRTAFRLTVVIPKKTAQGQLFKWLDLCHKFPIDEYLNAYGDPENWHIFKGKIKPSWIRAIDKKPEDEDVYWDTMREEWVLPSMEVEK
jgi:hypothetical protein